MSKFSFKFIDIPGSDAKNKLNIMQKAKTQRPGELFVNYMVICSFYMVISKT